MVIIVDMEKRFDAIIFGATGFTGKYVVENAVDVLKDYKWAIAGRNKAKLQSVLTELGKKNKRNLKNVPIVLADIADEQSLNQMAMQCKVILNCVGPYMLYGERVVKACIMAGTHHVDLSGEPQYFEGIHLKYHEEAKKSKAFIISTCGYESVPADLGVLYAEQKFDGTINSIEAYLENSVDYKDKSSKALLHHSTYDSFLEVIKNIGQMLRLQSLQQAKLARDLKPKLKTKLWPHKPSRLASYFLPFPADRTVVQQSQYFLQQHDQKRPIQFESYGGFRSLLTTLLVPLYILLGLLLAQLPWTFRLLKKFPDFFTLGIMTNAGPIQANADSHYFSITLRVKGWARGQSLTSEPTKESWERVSGFNPYYGSTSVILLTAAKVLLKDKAKMASSCGGGGVLPPGFAFAKTTFIHELSQAKKYPLKFELLD